jgi:hypothetical protein
MYVSYSAHLGGRLAVILSIYQPLSVLPSLNALQSDNLITSKFGVSAHVPNPCICIDQCAYLRES